MMQLRKILILRSPRSGRLEGRTSPKPCKMTAAWRLFRLDRGAGEAGFQRGLEGMPRQGRALYPNGIRLDAGQRLEPLGILLQRFGQLDGAAAGNAGMELREQLACLVEGLAFQHLGHQRGRRGRDRAAAPLEADIGDALALDREIDRHPVAAERVVPARQMRRVRQGAQIARVAAVIEDDVLIKLPQIHHRWNISRQASNASARRSMSASSL